MGCQGLLDAVQLLLHVFLAASQGPVAEQKPDDDPKSQDQADHEPACLLDVLAHLGGGLLDVVERIGQSVHGLLSDIATLQPHPLGLQFLDGGIRPASEAPGPRSWSTAATARVPESARSEHVAYSEPIAEPIGMVDQPEDHHLACTTLIRFLLHGSSQREKSSGESIGSM